MNVWLMIASYTFYGWWNPWLLLLLFGTSAIDYWMVLLMERKQSTRKLWLIISLVSNFGFLGFFKYSTFITNNLNACWPDWDVAVSAATAATNYINYLPRFLRPASSSTDRTIGSSRRSSCPSAFPFTRSSR